MATPEEAKAGGQPRSPTVMEALTHLRAAIKLLDAEPQSLAAIHVCQAIEELGGPSVLPLDDDDDAWTIPD